MLESLPQPLLQFIATVVLSFVLGLELHGYRRAQHEGVGFGTTRTLTLIGACGYLLWQLDPSAAHALYIAGLLVLALWLAIDLVRQRPSAGAGDDADTGAADDPRSGALLPGMIALLTYALGPLLLTQPDWLVAAVLIVAILMMAEKPLIRRISNAVPASEGVTLAKFILLVGVVLPLLPDAPIPGLPDISLSTIWLAVVAISAISYAGYLANSYLFPRAGALLTGVLGGLYSSTAATVVLARQAATDPALAAQAPAATLVATAMMYLRLLVLIALLGHGHAALALLPAFAPLTAGTLLVAAWAWRRQPTAPLPPGPGLPARNPLDLPVALLFAVLFVAFAAVTDLVTRHYGVGGLHLLSFAVGFSDIDPFVLALLAGHFQVGEPAVIGAILIATGSNNLLKAIYALGLSRNAPGMRLTALWLAATLPLTLLGLAALGV